MFGEDWHHAHRLSGFRHPLRLGSRDSSIVWPWPTESPKDND
jgi:hypothetical protein